MTREKTSLIFSALQNLVNITSSEQNAEKQIAIESLTAFQTVPDVDVVKKGESRVEEIDGIHVKLAETHSESTPVWTCISHVTDVPSDGNCGFQSFVEAAAVYGGTTAIGTVMPSTALEGRDLLVKFLSLKRREIETSVIENHGFQNAQYMLWKDLTTRDKQEKIQSPPSEPDNPLFEELCKSIYRPGLAGHWLASGLGKMKLHLLARALGVTLHCLSLGSYEKGPKILRQNMGPSIPLWTGTLHAIPKCGIVVRFLGEYDRGHYQVVRCGYRKAFSRQAITHSGISTFLKAPGRIETVYQAGRKRRIYPKLSKTISKGSNRQSGETLQKKLESSRKRQMQNIEDDVQVVDGLHGAQLSTKDRYGKDYRLIYRTFQGLFERGYDPLLLNINGSVVVDAIKKLLMHRCGPKSKGYEGLKASSTGNVLLAAVKSWYNDHGLTFSNNHVCVVRGDAVSGPPWRAQQVLEFKNALGKLQAKTGSNPVKRAYLLTHDDIASAMRRFVATQLGNALDARFSPSTNPSVNWMHFQTALMVTASFGSGCRGAELTSIKLSDVTLLSEGPDTVIGVTLQGVKDKTLSKIVRKIIFPSWKETSVINPSLAILIQLSVVHGTSDNQPGNDAPLFPHIERNQVQKGRRMSTETYSTAVKDMFKSLGITGRASEHSPRRGGSGFRHYFLGENLDYIRDFFSYDNIVDTLTYVGFRDRMNSYVIQGYGTCGTRIIR